MIPFDPEMRPVLDWNRTPHASVPGTIGTECPVCKRSIYVMQLDDFVEHPDGSATARCSNCRAPLRQNAEGFVFLASADALPKPESTGPRAGV